MFYEMKKFYKTTAVVISFVLALLFSIGMPILFIHDYVSYDYSTGKEVAINGLRGLKHKKEQIQKVSGTLDTYKLNKALAFYKSQPKGNTAYFKMEDKYPQYFSFLEDAYRHYGQDTFDIRNISDANNFYNRNIEMIKEKIHSSEKGFLSSSERQEVLNRAANLSKPYTLEFIDQWPILIKSLIFVYILIILSAFLISNRLFSFEKENNMDIILNSAGRKKLISIGFQKIFAMMAYLSLEFILCTAVTTTIVLGTTGVTGWNCQTQIVPKFLTVIYNWSIGDMFIYYLIIALICILAIALIGALINSVLQETYASFILSILLIYSPIFLKNSSLVSVGLKRYLCVCPINGISPLFYIFNLFVYKLGSTKVLTSCVIVIVSTILITIGIVASPILFSKRINKSVK